MRRLTLLLLCACGGGPGTFNGTVQSNPLAVADAVFLMGQEIWLSSTPGFCKQLLSNEYPKGGTLVKIVPTPVATGNFTVVNGALNGDMSIEFLKLDDSCNNTITGQAPFASGGTATLTSLEAMQSVSGTFDANFGSDHVTGSFNATFCDAPTIYPNPTCM